MKIQKILSELSLLLAKATVRKVKRVRKSYARKIQILTVGEQKKRKKTVDLYNKKKREEEQQEENETLD